MGRQKRQHFVPKSYLERFAENNLVYVRRRDGGHFETNPINVAVEGGFYDVVDDATGEKSSRVEETLAEIDGAAIEALRNIDRSGKPPAQNDPDRFQLAVFLALQNSRTPEVRERFLFPENLAKYAAGRDITIELVRAYLSEVHLRFDPSDRETRAAFEFATAILSGPGAVTREDAINFLGQTAQVAPLLAEMNWTLELDRKENLITSDAPLVIWRPPTPRDKFEGLGLMTAEEIRFPVDPGKQLVLSKRTRTVTARITPQKARECNQDLADACHRFVVGAPRRHPMIDDLRLGVHRPVLRFNIGPLYVPRSDGSLEQQSGEVIHTWVPRR